jgi:hypothetical protein
VTVTGVGYGFDTAVTQDQADEAMGGLCDIAPGTESETRRSTPPHEAPRAVAAEARR